MIEWSWRIENKRSIDCGSFSGCKKITNTIKGIEGLSIESIDVEGRIPEIVVSLSDGRTLRSFMTAEGQPEWTIFLNATKTEWIQVKRGSLQHVARKHTSNKQTTSKSSLG